MRYFDTLHNARALRRAQTEAEAIFWDRVRNRKFMGLKFNRQHIIEYAQILGNKLYYIADFHNYQFKTIIEIDGPIHLEQQEYDAERSSNIEALGFKVLRLTNNEVLFNWDEVERKLAIHFYSPQLDIELASPGAESFYSPQLDAELASPAPLSRERVTHGSMLMG